MSTVLHYESQTGRTATLEVPEGSIPPNLIRIEGVVFLHVPEPITPDRVHARAEDAAVLLERDPEAGEAAVICLLADLIAWIDGDDPDRAAVRAAVGHVAEELGDWIETQRSRV